MGLGHSLKCESLSQIWLLLKSSEFITHDLMQPFENCTDQHENFNVNYVLALKKWNDNVNPATEFRCFIKNGHLLGIEQRDPTNYYKYIADEKDDILRDIKSFFHENVQNKLKVNVVMDVTRPFKDKVKLVDFNPFGPTTDTHFFDWGYFEDMEAGAENDVVFRFIETSTGIIPSDLRQYSLPKDIVDLACGTDPDKFVDFLKLQA